MYGKNILTRFPYTPRSTTPNRRSVRNESSVDLKFPLLSSQVFPSLICFHPVRQQTPIFCVIWQLYSQKYYGISERPIIVRILKIRTMFGFGWVCLKKSEHCSDFKNTYIFLDAPLVHLYILSRANRGFWLQLK